MSSNPPGYKRCPSCGSRVAEADAVCDVCGHEFGTTQAIPPVRPIAQPPRPQPRPPAGTHPSPEDEPDAADAEPEQVEPEAPRAAGRPSALARLPWGVLGVAAVIMGILAAAFVLAPQALNQPSAAPTIEVIIQDPAAGVIALPTAEGDGQAGGAAALESTPSATPTAAPTAAPAPTATPVEYTVRAGDTCGGIAQRFAVDLDEFAALNNLDTVNCLIRVGDRLVVPVPTPTPGPTATLEPGATAPPTTEAVATATLPPEIVYIVRGGDTCSEIAQRFNVTIDLLIAQNNLDASCLIQLNQVLTITFATPTPMATVTPFILQTPTPRAGYDAPLVLAPQSGAQISETQDVVTLQWLTVGLLKPDEWYVVQVQPTGAVTVPVFETKATSLKLTQDILGGQVEREIAWWVQVRRRDPNAPAGVYVDVSPPSAVRNFVWRRPLSPPTPTPGG